TAPGVVRRRRAGRGAGRTVAVGHRGARVALAFITDCRTGHHGGRAAVNGLRAKVYAHAIQRPWDWARTGRRSPCAAPSWGAPESRLPPSRWSAYWPWPPAGAPAPAVGPGDRKST